ncbi:branched-chain amino acid ABC transporter substrate-binding protein [Methanoplanus endosymbiosus]|uniref:Branched-chain amino acid ABC transporter substrate-binding protein n=1 Tax=Methanoplanus endosymbiosus TaxID=33865 RepID=A0A9E7PNB5_9EURY|nr:branched-chain amino acid ABC transporter substrate-binding protein [Methanoplanus endosymbiosus]UUX93398.1 branched-chain amino acid ABC transporter substrate-binding protein [Methanoplanus endosymbiosus]
MKPGNICEILTPVNIAGLIIVGLVVFFSAYDILIIEPGDYPDEIVIGAILPLSGSLSNYGQEFKQGIDMAVDEINGGGGISGKMVEIDYFDNIGNPYMSKWAINYYADEGIPAVIGAVSSTATVAIAPIAEERGIVLISPSATNPALSDYKNYVFRTISSDKYQGRGIGKLLSVLHPELNRVALIYSDDDYGAGLSDSVFETYPKYGGHFILVESFDPNIYDFSALIEKIKGADPDGIILIGYYEQAVNILKAAEDAEVDAVWFGSEGLINDGLIEEIGDYSEGLTATMQSSQIHSDAFEERYYEKYGNDVINWPVPYGYDTTKILSEAIADGGYDAGEIKDSLKEIRYLGLCGPRHFDENGDIYPAYDVLTVTDGEWERIKWGEIVSDELKETYGH